MIPDLHAIPWFLPSEPMNALKALLLTSICSHTFLQCYNFCVALWLSIFLFLFLFLILIVMRGCWSGNSQRSFMAKKDRQSVMFPWHAMFGESGDVPTEPHASVHSHAVMCVLCPGDFNGIEHWQVLESSKWQVVVPNVYHGAGCSCRCRRGRPIYVAFLLGMDRPRYHRFLRQLWELDCSQKTRETLVKPLQFRTCEELEGGISQWCVALTAGVWMTVDS